MGWLAITIVINLVFVLSRFNWGGEVLPMLQSNNLDSKASLLQLIYRAMRGLG
jgi:hypothetical protein